MTTSWKNLILLSGLFVLMVVFILRPYYIVDIGYITRPLWDHPPEPLKIIPHFDNPEMTMTNAEWCSLHGWTEWRDETAGAESDSQKRQVVDAFIFSVELDILEIRMKELEHVVDKFVIVESNATFTGQPKEATFMKHRDHFRFIPSDRIFYELIPLYPLPPGKSPFYNEGQMKTAVTRLLRQESVGLREGDLVLMSDADEIISAETVRLLKACDGYPDSLHLQMRNYYYSFEFFYDLSNWKPHVEKWIPNETFFHHRLQPDTQFMLADAGWHCSFCFRYIEDFIFKMKSYSHSDRVRHSGFLDPGRIQKIICSGDDMFEMLPEEFTYREFISKLGPMPKLTTTKGLPKYLVTHPQQFRFLLPGGCLREPLPEVTRLDNQTSHELDMDNLKKHP